MKKMKTARDWYCNLTVNSFIQIKYFLSVLLSKARLSVQFITDINVGQRSGNLETEGVSLVFVKVQQKKQSKS